MDDKRCLYCVDMEGEYCDSVQPDAPNYSCTRKPGHAGPHVACGDDVHDVAKWPNTEEAE